MDDGAAQRLDDAEQDVPKAERRKVPESGAPWNDVENVIFTRRSVRLYRDKQVPEYLVRRMLEAARYAPSAGNCQPWRFVVVRDGVMLDEMTGFIREKIGLVSTWLDYTRPEGRAKRWVTERLMRLRPNDVHPTPLAAFSAIADGKLAIWHGAPTVIFLLADMRGAGSPLLDAGIAGQNMVLTAHSMGLGTCWVSFAKVLEMSKKYRDILQLKHPYKLATSIAVGFPRGVPDGYVPRETHESLWIEDGGKTRVVT
ncbi:MAG TPA: nitroreductase family protein [Polyangiales bacterium]|jgi:nitroreductase